MRFWVAQASVRKSPADGGAPIRDLPPCHALTSLSELPNRDGLVAEDPLSGSEVGARQGRILLRDLQHPVMVSTYEGSRGDRTGTFNLRQVGRGFMIRKARALTVRGCR